jgi:probable rRNA maturation factor
VKLYLRTTTRKHKLALDAIERTVGALLEAIGKPDAALSLSFVGDAAIRRLNREHRGKDRATDVLSFPLHDPSENLLGDIVISLDTAARQAAAYDADLHTEVERLLIHGLLHVMGHDHEAPEERCLMEAEEKRLARAIGMDWPYLENS